MNYYSDRSHGSPKSGGGNTSSLFQNWDQNYDSRMNDVSLNMGHSSSATLNCNNYSLSQDNHQDNSWSSPSLQEPALPDDLRDLQIYGMDSTSHWRHDTPMHGPFSSNGEDSLSVAPPDVERRYDSNYPLSNPSNIAYKDNVYCWPSRSNFNSYCPLSPDEDRLSPGPEEDTQQPVDQGIGLTKDGQPRKRRPKKSLLHLTKEDKRAHERELNRDSTAKYRRRKAQERKSLTPEPELY